jgi:hypothetical protein
MGGDQVHQEQTAYKVTARPNRRFPIRSIRAPPYEKAIEELILNDVEAKLHLSQGANEYKAKSSREAGHRKP